MQKFIPFAVVLLPCLCVAEGVPAQPQTPQPPEHSPVVRSVVLVTIEDVDRRASDDWLAEARDAWPKLEKEGQANWWFGRGFTGSNLPVRSLYGLLTGTAPLEADRLSRMPRNTLATLSLPLAVGVGLSDDGRGATPPGNNVAAWVGGFRGERQEVARLVPEPLRYNQLRPVMASLRELEPPLFFWLAVETSRRNKRAGPIETIDRVLTLLQRRGIHDQTLVVVTSVHPTSPAGSVPLALRLPATARSLAPGWMLPESPKPVTLEAVGSAMREWIGLPLSPAMAPAGKQRWLAPISVSEVREMRDVRRQSTLVGVTARDSEGTLRVSWPLGRLSTCLERSSVQCTWQFEPNRPDPHEPKPRASELLESAVLLALERQIARTTP